MMTQASKVGGAFCLCCSSALVVSGWPRMLHALAIASSLHIIRARVGMKALWGTELTASSTVSSPSDHGRMTIMSLERKSHLRSMMFSRSSSQDSEIKKE